MVNGASAVMNLLIKRGFETYYIGGKCRTEIHNKLHLDKIQIKDIDIVTNATSKDIKQLFPNSNIRGESFQVVVVNFGGFEFEVATYRQDIYEESLTGDAIVKPKTVVASNLDDDRERRDFTINAIAQDIDGNYIDYKYIYRNRKISAINDIHNKQIRAIGNPKLRFTEDPLRILRAFRFAAQLGYQIEKQTLKAIENNLNLLEKIPHERIALEMNKLILGRHASDILKLMKCIGVFNIKTKNALNVPTTILPSINVLTDEQLDVLNILNSSKFTIEPIEAWTLLLKPLGSETAKINLESIQALNNIDIRKVEWLIDHFTLTESEDLKNDIFKSKVGIIKDLKFNGMKDLIKKLCAINTKLGHKEKAEKLMYAFCSRPYFDEQIKVNGETLMKIANKGPGQWISVVKEKLLFKLINTEKFPKDEEYMKLVNETVQEVLSE